MGRHTKLIAILIISMVIALLQIPDASAERIEMTKDYTGSNQAVPVGCEATIAGSAYDAESGPPNIIYDPLTVGVPDGWSGTVVNGNQASWVLTKTCGSPSEEIATITVADTNGCSLHTGFGVFSGSYGVGWFGPSDIVGPDKFCKGDCPLTVEWLPGEPPAMFMVWYYRKPGDTTWVRIDSSAYGLRVPQLNLDPGKYEIGVRAQIGIFQPSIDLYGKKKIVEIIDPDAYAAKKNAECPASGGCGTCPGGAGDVAAPGMMSPSVDVNGDGAGPGAGYNDDVCGKPGVVVIPCHTCGNPADQVTYHWYANKGCGGWRVISFSGTSPFMADLGGGDTLERHGPPTATSWTTTMKVGGYTYEFAAVPTGTAPVFSVAKLTSMTDPDGNVTTYTESGGVLSVSSPTGGDWSYTFDVFGKVRTSTAPDGTSTTTTRSTSGWSTGKVTSITTYDSSHNQLSDTEYTYDATYGPLTSMTKNGRTVAYEYGLDGNHNITDITVTEQSANPQMVTMYSYTPTATTVTRKHSTDSTKDQATVTEYYTSTINGVVIKTYPYKVTDPYGHETKSCLWIDANTNSNIPTADRQITSNVNLIGKAFKTVDALGNETTYDYDSSTGNLTTVTYPGGATETTSYYTGTNYTKTSKNIRGNYTHYVRNANALWQVSAVQVDSSDHTDWSSIPTIKEYEYYGANDTHGENGTLKIERVPNIDGSTPNLKTYEYDETVNNQTVLRSSPTRSYYQYWDTTTSSYITKYDQTSYDDMGHVMSTTDANGRSIFYTYDSQGRQLKTIYQLSPEISSETHYEGCCTGPSWTRDEDGRKTYYAYDSLNRVTDTWTDITGQSQATPLAHYVYDVFGRRCTLSTRTDASSVRTTTYTYDNANRLIRIDYPSPLGYEAFGYDAVGRQVWQRDGNGAVTLIKYDYLNRPTNVYYNYTGTLLPLVYPTTADVTYGYLGSTGLKSSMIDSSGTSSYSYDIQDRLTSYSPPRPASHAAVTYTYNTLGQKTSISTANYEVAYDYYANGWLKDVKKSGSLIANFEYDDAGNRIEQAYGNGTKQAYAYDNDPRYRLEQINYWYRCDSQSQITNNGGLRLTRDSVGNPLTWGDQDNTYRRVYTYDEDRRVNSAISPGQGETTFTYDWVGNRLDLPGSSYSADELTLEGGHSYGYDGRGNLTTIDSLTKYTYTPANLLAAVSGGTSMISDGRKNRVSFTTSQGQDYQFVYDTTARIPAVVEELFGGHTVFYVREPNGTLICRIDGETVAYYGFDALGSTLFLTESSGIVTDKYVYNVWGSVASHVGTTQQPYQYEGRQGYYTHYQDSNLPLIQLGVRYYDPGVGRFTQRDPAREGYCWYAYVANRPTILSDPTGRTKTQACAVIPHGKSEDGGGADPAGHAWLCVDGKCWGCYPNYDVVDFFLGRGIIYDDSPHMKGGRATRGECWEITNVPCKRKFDACMRKAAADTKEGDRCFWWLPLASCTTYVIDTLVGCGAPIKERPLLPTSLGHALLPAIVGGG